MRIRWTIAVGTCWLLALLAGGGKAQELSGKPLAETRLAATPQVDPEYVIGDAYTIAVQRGSAKESFGGNLVKVNDAWIVLRRISEGRSESGVPLLSGLPKVGGMFRKTSVGLVEADLWIPREAASVETHRRLTNVARTKPIGANRPPARMRCALTMAQKDAAVSLDGNLAAVNDKGVVLLTGGSGWTQQQMQVGQEAILCIAISNVVNNVRMTQRGDAKGQ